MFDHVTQRFLLPQRLRFGSRCRRFSHRLFLLLVPLLASTILISSIWQSFSRQEC